ncbi:MAG TPA: FliM/FliN family flagellar motor switch protein [Sphingomonas sp.]|nr:FliM/FliN family flagellar motor switch protein [Sphingomonas sp.]
MVNGPSPDSPERRERTRQADHVALGVANLNPFGDLHTVQHLSARLARSLRSVFEPLLRQEVRTFAEPLAVQRFADYRAERADALTAWLPLEITPGNGAALAVFDGRFVLEMLDLFFGGTGHAPHDLPSEFSPSAEAIVARLGGMLAEPMRVAWEPLARLKFAPGHAESNPAMLGGLDGDDALVVTRIGIAAGNAKPIFIDLLYPVVALKPYAPSLNGKVLSKTAEQEPAWRTGLTRAVMGVRFPIRSVLAEPVISLATLMELKIGDVIPISVDKDVPVMVGGDRLGSGTVGTSNGKAAIKLNQITRELGEFQ